MSLVKDLVQRKLELQRELRKVNLEIERVQKECEHKNAYETRRYQDPGSGRTTYDMTCPDCELDY